jgi:hypothetical protein
VFLVTPILRTLLQRLDPLDILFLIILGFDSSWSKRTQTANLKRKAAANNLDILFNPCRDPLTGTVYIVFFCVALDASRASADASSG